MRGRPIGLVAAAILALPLAACGVASPRAAPAPAAEAEAEAPPKQAPFAKPTFVPAPKEPRAIAAADFDRDGLADLAVASERGEAVSVLRNDGSGGFELTTLRGGGAALAVADLDSDGAPDIVSANRYDGSELYLYRGLGDGTFAEPVAHPSGGSGVNGVAVADLDADGDLDLATANGSNDVSILRGDGRGGLAYPVRTGDLGASEGFDSMVAIDLGADRSADLAAISYEGLALLRNDGRGGFAAPAALDRVETFRGVVKVADVNADGHPDLLSAGNHIVSVRLGDGAGGLGAPLQESVPRSQIQDLAVGDLNGDGRPDLALSDGSGDSVSVLLAAGENGFRKSARIKIPSTVYGVVIAPLDGDCALDIAAGSANYKKVAILRNTRESTCDRPPPAAGEIRSGAFPAAPAAPRVELPDGAGFADPVVTRAGGNYAPPALVDLNMDGHRDLVLQGGSKHRFTVRLGRADGSFGPALYTPAPALTKPSQPPCNDTFVGEVGSRGMSAGRPTVAASCLALVDGPSGLAVADLDGDGHPDLVTGTANGDSVAVFRGDGSGRFEAQRRYLTGKGSAPSDVLTGDLDGDGSIDVLARGGVGTIRTSSIVLLNDGTGRLRDIRTTKANNARALGDLDGDGDLDLLAVEQRYRHEARVTSWFNDGSARFTRGPRLDLPPKNEGSSTFDGAVLRDVDGDRVLDLLGVAPAAREVRVLRGVGDGSFEAARSFATGGADPAALEIGDVTGDGRADLVVANQGSDEFAVLAADGDGRFAAAVAFRSGGRGPFALFLADVDGDKRLDVLTFHVDPSVVAVHRAVPATDP